MFRRILIANRGEIALRVIRACREMGIGTVAVYSDADAAAPHVVAADQAVRVGRAPSADSYLRIGAIVDAARATGAEAIHPGYGFLSENPAFAAACDAAGLTFIGPPAAAIEAMGSKIGARRLAAGAGVPVVPGETPDDQSDAALTAAIRRTGFPALLKPSGGGGGIGMKVVRAETEVGEAIAQARREAAAAFDDDTLFVERLVERPRHVEIQVFADAHGGCVHLFERECSVQRRHQKTIEESPCPALTPDLRRRMGDAAVALTRAAGYRNAGTIEFLLEGEGGRARFYFLEMNTRLQVEHPVTEVVTGRDLVHAQIRVAAGERLPWAQADLSQRGHAIECRIYAEDLARHFLPQAGRLLLYREPSMPGVRIDSGVTEGSDVTVYYDPLIAKLIAGADTRDAARRRAVSALRQYPVLGIRTNIPLLLQVLEHPRFVEGSIDTGFLDTHVEAFVDALATPAIPGAAIAAAASREDAPATPPAAARAGTAPAGDPWATLAGWRN